MKIALVHDWLVTFGGAEWVLKCIYDLYPSVIYTLVKNESFIKNSPFKEAKIYTSFIQNLPFSQTKYRNYLPFFPIAIEQFDLSEYDIIISSSFAVAKGVLTNHEQLHISYCHTPVRYAWDLYHNYLKEKKLNFLKSTIAKATLHYLRMWDVISSNRVDYYIANSRYVANRIKKIYGKEAKVIYPPINLELFKYEGNKDNYYIYAGRLTNVYKRVDMIVEAFNKIGKKLLIVGDGEDLNKLKRIARGNIEFLGWKNRDELSILLGKAKALIMPSIEDFGMIALEAQACGTPVIAFKGGGALETVIDGITGIFFDKQDANSLIEAIERFESTEDKFDTQIIRNNSERFSEFRFKREFKDFVDEKIEHYFKQ